MASNTNSPRNSCIFAMRALDKYNPCTQVLGVATPDMTIYVDNNIVLKRQWINYPTVSKIYSVTFLYKINNDSESYTVSNRYKQMIHNTLQKEIEKL